jgi:FecR protein
MVRIWFRGAMLSLALMLVSGSASGETRIGAVIERNYTGAIGQRAGQDETERLFYNHAVYSEQQVKTGRDAMTRLRFLDSTELTVAGSSNVVLDRFVYDPDSGAGEAVLTFGKGAFRFVTGKMRTKEAVTLQTPTATIAIRGTHLVLDVHSDGSADLSVIEGAVLVRPCGNVASVEVAQGSTILIAARCAPPLVRSGYNIPRQLQYFDNYPEKQQRGEGGEGTRDGGDKGNRGKG